MYDATPMFKMLVLQSLYKLFDHHAECQVRDRLSSKRFLRLWSQDTVSDA